jgi:hypothetical protein
MQRRQYGSDVQCPMSTTPSESSIPCCSSISLLCSSVPLSFPSTRPSFVRWSSVTHRRPFPINFVLYLSLRRSARGPLPCISHPLVIRHSSVLHPSSVRLVPPQLFVSASYAHLPVNSVCFSSSRPPSDREPSCVVDHGFALARATWLREVHSSHLLLPPACH